MKFGLLTSFLLFTYFCVAQTVSWNVQFLGNWYDSDIPFTGKSSTYNEVWGFEWKGKEYGVIGSRKGTYIIDVTEAEYPRLVDFIPGAYDNAINRDFKDYHGYLYMVADQGASTLQILDLHHLPDSVVLVYDSNNLFQRCHNLFIDSVAARMYACSAKRDSLFPGDSAYSYDLQIYSLIDPAHPTLMISYDESPDVFHDIYVKNDTAFGNNARSGLFVYDFTNLAKPKIIGSLTDYPGKGYNHNGWVSEDGKYYFFTDETNGSDIKACDISNIDDIEVISTFNSGTADDAIAHNAIVKGNFLYISYYHDGLQIFDIADPANPEKTGYYDTYLRPDHEGSKGAWGVYPFLPSGNILVSDREKGLIILDVTEALNYEKPNPPSPQLVEIYPNPFSTALTITILEGQTINSIKVFDIRGNKVLENRPEENVTTYVYNGAETLPAGVYIIRLEGKNLSCNMKLVKSF